MEETQLRLFYEPNPLKTYFSNEFFKQIPQAPGIYWMLDEKERILYVGKAKNLRNRLKSYRHTATERLPGKTRDLLRGVKDIRWQTTEDEASALLLENEWLRRLKPRFNVLNTRPETYLYFGFELQPEFIELGLYYDATVIPDSMKSFGAYRGIGRTRRAHPALLRWLWAVQFENTLWPHCLSKRTAPVNYRIEFTKSLNNEEFETLRFVLESFFAGRDALPELFIPHEDPHRYLQELWQLDQILLANFFRYGASAYREIKENFGIRENLIRQESIDDLRTLLTFSRVEAKLETRKN